MTNPMGLSFLSYRRSRIEEAKLLTQAQKDHGIPTWQDVNNLENAPLESQLRETLDNEDTANAVMWITPDVDSSDVINNIEAPCILNRSLSDNDFFVIPYLAGGLDYSDVDNVLKNVITLNQLNNWNLNKINTDPINYKDACDVTCRILEHRLKTINASLPSNAPIRIGLYTRIKPPVTLNKALIFDWQDHFSATSDYRNANKTDWQKILLPAMKTSIASVTRLCPERPIEIEGFCGIPSAIMLGYTCMQPSPNRAFWVQDFGNGKKEVWSNEVTPTQIELDIKTTPNKPAGKDIALLLSTNHNIEPAFLKKAMPDLRAVLSISSHAEPNINAGQAKYFVDTVKHELINTRNEYNFSGTLHIFMASPIGLAMLVGQAFNTFAPIQTYEYVQSNSGGEYKPAVLLR